MNSSESIEIKLNATEVPIDDAGLQADVVEERPSKVSLSYRPDGLTHPMSEVAKGRASVEFQKLSQQVDLAIEKQRRSKDGRQETGFTELKAESEQVKAIMATDDHSVSIDDFLIRYDTDPKGGLADYERANRLTKYGPNMLTPPPETFWLITLLKHIFANVFAILLWLACLLSIIAYVIPKFSKKEEADMSNIYIAIALAICNTITGFVSYFQEAKSSAIMKGFANLTPPMSTIVVDGGKTVLPAVSLVPGDLVELKAGDKVPADCRVVRASGFKVDNSSLTGESLPCQRTPECTHENLLETDNCVFFGTLVVEGTASVIVFKTGDHTQMGQIAALASKDNERDTPIAIEIKHFVKIISIIAVLIGVLFFILSMVRGDNALKAIVMAIGLIVANVPEGLLLTVTVSLTLSAKRMAAKSVLVKQLEAVETLGSTSAICSDKTGTLTQNKMTCSNIYTSGNVSKLAVSFNNSTFSGMPTDDATYEHLLRLLSLCSRSEYDFGDKENTGKPLFQTILGDATEAAFLRFCTVVSDVQKTRELYPKIAEIPFSSVNKWSVTVHARMPSEEDQRPYLYMKGAPERIITRCTHIMINGKVVPITSEHIDQFQKTYDQLGGLGERVLGMAMNHLPVEPYAQDGYEFDFSNFEYLEGLTFIGLVSVVDPPRDAVPKAVQDCYNASVRVAMVTGDHKLTAQAIAREIGIIRGETVAEVAAKYNIPQSEVITFNEKYNATAHVIAGDELAELTDDELQEIVSKFKELVFARTSPKQKYRIVCAFQSQGHIVGVTGDGVNDSAAISQADLGIAMGIAGTEVTKDAADVVLLNDDFSSIVSGIKEGRTIFDNLKKSIAYTLTSNIPEIFPFLFNIAAKWPLTMTVPLILGIDLGTDLIPALSISKEEAEGDILSRPPRDSKKDRLVNWQLIFFSYAQIGLLFQAPASFVAFFYVLCNESEAKYPIMSLLRGKITVPETDPALGMARTAAFLAVIFMQVIDAIISKARRKSSFQQGWNMLMFIGIIFEIALGCLLCYTPGIQKAFGTGPCPVKYMAVVFPPFMLGMLFYDEARKWLCRRHPNTWFSYVFGW